MTRNLSPILGRIAVAGLAAMLGACGETSAEAPPPPALLTDEALSYFCRMNVDEHGGPNAQIHLDGGPAPLFFAQVRDGLAYLRSEERTLPISVVYVSDMARAPSWEKPGADNWIAVGEAHFVVGSDARGGMGAPEIAPFGDAAAAERFAEKHGGSVMRLAEIPDAALFGEVEPAPPAAETN